VLVLIELGVTDPVPALDTPALPHPGPATLLAWCAGW
jgi:hypothetical protein